MNIIFVISFICGVCFTLLFAFPKFFLAKINYKKIDYPDDYEDRDVIFMRVIFLVFMIASWALLFVSAEILSQAL